MDKTKENTRIATLLAMSEDAVKTKMAVGIENPAIYKQFIAEEELNWDYAVAAGLLSEDDVKWIKENVNEGGQDDQGADDQTEEPVNPDAPDGE